MTQTGVGSLLLHLRSYLTRLQCIAAGGALRRGVGNPVPDPCRSEWLTRGPRVWPPGLFDPTSGGDVGGGGGGGSSGTLSPIWGVCG